MRMSNGKRGKICEESSNKPEGKLAKKFNVAKNLNEFNTSHGL
jgi:hypothetical protein